MLWILWLSIALCVAVAITCVVVSKYRTKKRNITVAAKNAAIQSAKSSSSEPDEVNAKQWLSNFLARFKDIPEDHTIIMSAHCSILSFLEAQHESIRAFCKVPYTYIVLNDANVSSRPEQHRAIHDYCKRNNIHHVPIPELMHRNRNVIFPDDGSSIKNMDYSDPSYRASVGVQIMTHLFRTHNGYCLMLDSDSSFVNTFDPYVILPKTLPETYGANSQHKGPPEHRITYIWIPFVLFDMSRFPHPEWMNLDVGNVDGIQLDTGGKWCYYLNKMQATENPPNPPYKEFTCLYGKNTNNEAVKKFIVDNPDMHVETAEFYEGCLLHLHNGSGWNDFNRDIQKERAKRFLAFIRELIHMAAT
jgi:hypothetical protein